LQGVFVSPLSKPHAGGPPLVGCLRLIMQYRYRHQPHLEAFYSFQVTLAKVVYLFRV